MRHQASNIQHPNVEHQKVACCSVLSHLCDLSLLSLLCLCVLGSLLEAMPFDMLFGSSVFDQPWQHECLCSVRVCVYAWCVCVCVCHVRVCASSMMLNFTCFAYGSKDTRLYFIPMVAV